MRPSLLTIYLKCGLAVLCGGALSLLISGQFGIGLEHAFLHFNHDPHYHADDLASALACGIVFALLPPFFLRLFSSALQFRVIARQSIHVAIIWLVGLGGLLAHHGQNAIQVISFVIWSAAAVGTFIAVSRTIDHVAFHWTVRAPGKNR